MLPNIVFFFSFCFYSFLVQNIAKKYAKSAGKKVNYNAGCGIPAHGINSPLVALNQHIRGLDMSPTVGNKINTVFVFLFQDFLFLLLTVLCREFLCVCVCVWKRCIIRFETPKIVFANFFSLAKVKVD